MKRTLILIAGPPATGKTYLIQQMRTIIPDFFLVTPDEIKELLADRTGFTTLEEKKELEKEVWLNYYEILEKFMYLGKKFIVTEYPFSEKQKPNLRHLALQYEYQVLTIRLAADFEILWERRRKRDLEEDRHLSFIVSAYHDGDVLQDRSQADDLITKEAFQKIVKERAYNHFELGELYEVDVSDYSKINYKDLLKKIQKNL